MNDLIIKSVNVGPYKFQIEMFKDIDAEVDRYIESSTGEIEERNIPLFGHLWPSARALVMELLNWDLKDKKVLELGCGLALPSMVASKMGSYVTAIDHNPSTWDLLKLNVPQNDILNFDFIEIDWNRFPEKVLGEFDIIIGSDIIYNPENEHYLHRFILKNLNTQGQVIISDPKRIKFGSFLDGLKKIGLDCQTKNQTVTDQNGPCQIKIVQASRCR